MKQLGWSISLRVLRPPSPRLRRRSSPGQPFSTTSASATLAVDSSNGVWHKHIRYLGRSDVYSPPPRECYYRRQVAKCELDFRWRMPFHSIGLSARSSTSRPDTAPDELFTMSECPSMESRQRELDEARKRLLILILKNEADRRSRQFGELVANQASS